MNFHIPLVLLPVCSLAGLTSACVHKILPPSASSGYISSPDYPNPYPPGQCLIWFIYSRNSHMHITIRILDLYLPTPTIDGSCPGNSLTFGPSDRRSYCGSVKNELYEAEQNDFFFIMFNSSMSGPTGKGFVLHYSFEDASEPPQIDNERAEMTGVSPTYKPTLKSYHQCSSVIKTNKGHINLYESQLNSMTDSLQCTWLLTQERTYPRNGYSAYVLKFTFLHLYPGCFLKVYGGSNELGQFYREFSSDTSAPQQIEILGTSAFVKLTVPRSLLLKGSVGNFSMEYEMRVECKVGYKACGFNESLCYYFEKRCDGVWDCPESGGDERGCSSSVSDTCEGHKFSCMENSGYCYTSADRCNGKVTCVNYRDELDCSPDVCSSSKGLFLCKNRRCIYEKWTCDSTDDCGDGSDEDDCNSWESPRIIMAAVVGSVLCSLFLVIAMSFSCKLYALHNHRHRGERGRETPLSRYEAELLRQRPPPPSYPEAMLTSRPYEEAYLELLSDAGNSEHNNDELPRYEEDPTHHSTHPSDPRREQDNSGRRRRRQRRRHRRRNVQQSARPSSGVLATANQQCQLLLHRAGLAPPPYSLIQASAEPEHSSSDIEDGGDGEEEGGHGVAPEVEDESPSEEISSLSSAENAGHIDHPHVSSSPIFESNFSPAGDDSSENAQRLDSTMGVNLSFENCDKDSDDSSESSDTTGDTEVVETSLSFTHANDGEMPTADGELDDDEEEEREDDDSDDCPCILAEGNETADESRIRDDDLDSECILNQ